METPSSTRRKTHDPRHVLLMATPTIFPSQVSKFPPLNKKKMDSQGIWDYEILKKDSFFISHRFRNVFLVFDEDSEKSVSNSRRKDVKQQQDRSTALTDIKNDSSIVGLAMGSLGTPASAIGKQRSSRANNSNTPDSAEALLRGQVRILLQRVEEEADLSKLSLENCPFLNLRGFVSSPMGLLALTLANTPQVPNLSGDDGDTSDSGMASVTPLPIVEQLKEVSDILDGKKLNSLESQKSLARSLLSD